MALGREMDEGPLEPLQLLELGVERFDMLQCKNLHLRPGADRNPDIRLRQGGCVVDAVADEHDLAAADALSAAKLTLASTTPAAELSAFSTRPTQDAQFMPLTEMLTDLPVSPPSEPVGKAWTESMAPLLVSSRSVRRRRSGSIYWKVNTGAEI